jgi:hypothetical protein
VSELPQPNPEHYGDVYNGTAAPLIGNTAPYAWVAAILSKMLQSNAIPRPNDMFFSNLQTNKELQRLLDQMYREMMNAVYTSAGAVDSEVDDVVTDGGIPMPETVSELQWTDTMLIMNGYNVDDLDGTVPKRMSLSDIPPEYYDDPEAQSIYLQQYICKDEILCPPDERMQFKSLALDSVFTYKLVNIWMKSNRIARIDTSVLSQMHGNVLHDAILEIFHPIAVALEGPAAFYMPSAMTRRMTTTRVMYSPKYPRWPALALDLYMRYSNVRMVPVTFFDDVKRRMNDIEAGLAYFDDVMRSIVSPFDSNGKRVHPKDPMKWKVRSSYSTSAAFSETIGLTDLLLRGNDISEVPVGFFDNITFLYDLSLSNNDINFYVHDISAGQYGNLTCNTVLNTYAIPTPWDMCMEDNCNNTLKCLLVAKHMYQNTECRTTFFTGPVLMDSVYRRAGEDPAEEDTGYEPVLTDAELLELMIDAKKRQDQEMPVKIHTRRSASSLPIECNVMEEEEEEEDPVTPLPPCDEADANEDCVKQAVRGVADLINTQSAAISNAKANKKTHKKTSHADEY